MMPAKKKTTSTANIPRSGITDPSYPLVDNRRRMATGYGSPVGPTSMGEIDPVRQIQHEKDQDLLQEYRDLKRKKERQKLEIEMNQMKQSIGAVDTSGGGLNIRGMYSFTQPELTAISQMPDADKEKFFETMRQIQLMGAMQPRGGVGGGMGNPILQMMAMGGFNRQGQGLGLKDVMEMQNMMRTIYEGAGKGNQELTNTLLMKLMTETVPGLQQQANQATQQGLGAVIQMLQANQSDPMRDLKYAKEMATNLGYAPMNTSVEVAKMQITMQDKWKAVEHQDRRDELKYRRDLGIIQQLISAAQGFTKNVTRGHISSLFTPKPVPQSVEPQPAVQQATTPVQPVDQRITHKIPPDAQVPNRVQLIQYTCQKCGQPMTAPAGVTQVACPACGQVHNA